MKTPSITLFLLFALFHAHTETSHLSLTTKGSINLGFAEARVQLENTDIRSWFARFSPVHGLSVFTGAVSLNGLPARAHNPVFPLGSSFYNPLAPVPVRTISAGTGLNTTNAAFELNRFGLRTSGLYGAERPSWLHISARLVKGSQKGIRMTGALIAGTFTESHSNDSSWWLAETPYTTRRFISCGAELLAAWRGFGANTLALAYYHPLKPLSFALRSDISHTGTYHSFSCGVYSSDRDFRDMNGKMNPVLTRQFIAAAVRANRFLNVPVRIRAGGIVWKDRIRRDEVSEPDSERISWRTEVHAVIQTVELKASVYNKDTREILRGLAEYTRSVGTIRFYGGISAERIPDERGGSNRVYTGMSLSRRAHIEAGYETGSPGFSPLGEGTYDIAYSFALEKDSRRMETTGTMNWNSATNDVLIKLGIHITLH